MLASPVPTDAVVAMRLNAIVIDLAVLGPQAWDYLEKLCAALPGLGVVVCTGAVDRRPAGARPAPRRRRLAHEAVPPRGAARPRRGGRAPPPPRRGARGALADPRRRGRDPRRSLPGLRRRRLRRPDTARVRAHRAARRGRGTRAGARGDLPAGLGLRDGPRRPLGRRVRAQAAPEAREGVARVALHPHALRRRVPVLARAGRGHAAGGRGRRGDAVGRPCGRRRRCGGGFRAGSGGRRAGADLGRAVAGRAPVRSTATRRTPTRWSSHARSVVS